MNHALAQSIRKSSQLDHFVCPSCHKPIVDADGMIARQCCGRAIDHDGTIANFLGDRAHIFGEKRDSDIAKSLVSHKTEVAAALCQLGSPAHEAHDVLFRVAGLTYAELETLERNLPLEQILNNIGDYRADVRTTSPTIEFLRANTQADARSHVLDAGCSAGRHMLEIEWSGAKLTGLDIRRLGLCVGQSMWPATARSVPTFCTADVTSIPLATGTVTHVVSCVVLGLVPARATLREFARILAPKGRLVLTVEGPGFRREVLDHTPALHPRRLGLMRWWLGQKLMEFGIDWQSRSWSRRLTSLTQYDPKTLAQLVHECGFDVEKLDTLTQYRGQPRLVGIVATKR